MKILCLGPLTLSLDTAAATPHTKGLAGRGLNQELPWNFSPWLQHSNSNSSVPCLAEGGGRSQPCVTAWCLWQSDIIG